MKKLLFAALMIWSGAALCSELTFQQALDQMVRQNPLLVQHRIESETSILRWKQTKASYYPQIDFLQGWSHSNNPVYVFGSLLNQQRFSETNLAIDSLNQPDAITDVFSRLQAGWLIYDFGKREGQIRSARSGHDISLLQQESVRLSLLQELVRRYFAVSLAGQRLSVAIEALTSAQATMRQARDRVEQGMAVQSDQLVAEVFLAQRMQEKIEAENQRKVAMAALDELLGVTQMEATVTDELEGRDFPPQQLSWWEEEMRQRRPELKITEQAIQIARSQVSIQKSNFLPSLQAWSSYEWHGDSLDYTGNNWGAGVELRWNLFRGFSDSKELSAAQLQEQKAQEKQREIKNQITLQLKEAYFQFQSAREKLSVAAAAIKHAAKSERIHADRYEEGLVTIQDALQAKTAYKETRLMYSQNLYELYVAYASLLSAAGMGDEIETISSVGDSQ